MNEHLYIVSDKGTRFEGTSVATALRDSTKYKTYNTIFTTIDAGSLSKAFSQIAVTGNADVFLCLSTDIVEKRIKVDATVDEIKNICNNLKQINCRPIFVFSYFDCSTNELRKKKMRLFEKGIVDMCSRSNIQFIRANLLSKGDYFFCDQGKTLLISKVSEHCKALKEKNKVVADNRSVKQVSSSKTLVITKARKIIQ